MTAAKVRLSALGFSDDVVTRLHMADLRSATAMAELVPRNGTNYGAAFGHLITQIPTDVKRLKAERFAVHRPAVVFLSDGQPSDADWMVNRTRLADRSLVHGAPNIIACGIGDAVPKTVLDIATSPDFAYVSIQGDDVGAAIAKFCVALTKRGRFRPRHRQRHR